MNQAALLQSVKFGERIAEEETENLMSYFLETEDWRRVITGEVDIIYGSKGAGKSAIYTILEKNRDTLFDDNILLTTAENPRGNTVFEGLSVSPPTSEVEFVRLWKLYFLIITVVEFNQWSVDNKPFRELKKVLEDSDLIPAQQGLAAILKKCRDYIRHFMQLESIQPGIEFDGMTGSPSGANFKVTFREPNKEELAEGIKSIDYLYKVLEDGLIESGFKLWIAVDRLDVAFTENIELETNALKALFKAYRDLSSLQNLKIKIFLRDDIWRRITETGMREGSHITKTLTIDWNRESLINLLTRRILNNSIIIEKFAIDATSVMGQFEEQEKLFYRLFPEQIDVGSKKTSTIDWVMGRLRDGKGIVAPRELVHLFNEAKQEQIRRIQIGQNDLEFENIIGRNAFKSALSTVSKVRLEQTLYSEFPTLKDYIAKMEGEKTEQNTENLSRIWELGREETIVIARKLIDIGFFELRGDKQNPRYWVPFIYRNELEMSQGKAEQNQ